MRARDAVQAKKVVVDWGKWTNDKMGKAVFPLSKRRGGSLRYGTSHRWRLIRFEALGREFRLLVAFRQDVPEFKTHLALANGDDLTMLCRWEYHGTHPGWHFHACCGDAAEIKPGVFHPSGMKRLPASRQLHRRVDYQPPSYRTMNDNAALEVVKYRFRLDPDDLLSFVEAPR